MKRLLFKLVSITLIFAHIFTFIPRGCAFAADTPKASGQSVKGHKIRAEYASAKGSAPISAASLQSASLPQGLAVSSSGYSSSVPPSTLQAAVGLNAAVLNSFQADLFTGRASTALPIMAPPGRKGIQPSISINYNTGSADGILGVGWSLELGSIERSTKNGVPKYGSSDTFLFNSQELICIGNNRYMPKIEGSFSRIIFNGSSWEVTDKAGTTYIFGQDAGHRVESGSKAFKWGLQKVTDIFGNYMLVDYIIKGGQLHPYQIRYTGNGLTAPSNLIQFDYSQERPDKISTYRPGFKLETTNLLSSITTYANSIRQRKYVFEYKRNSTNIRCLLSSVTEYGKDDSLSMPKITFEYKHNDLGWDASSTYLPQEAHLGPFSYLADVNNDGYIDILRHYYLGNNQFVRRTFLGAKDSWQETGQWYPPEGLTFGWTAENLRDNGIRLVDVNADGWVDMVRSQNGENGVYKGVWLNNKANGWVRDSSWDVPSDAYVIYVHVSGFQWHEYGGVLFTDVNADGFVDILRSTGSISFTYINTRSGWRKEAGWAMPDGSLLDGSTQFADLNADGLLDFLILSDSKRRAYINNGNGWQNDDTFVPAAGNFSDGSSQLIDVNEDGYADLVIAGDSGRRTFLNTVSSGRGWQEFSALALPEGRLSNYGTRMNDTTGKNTPDILLNASGERRVYINRGKNIDYLTSISNGLGGKVSVSYKSSLNYDNKGDDGISDLSFPMQTVSSVTIEDGRGMSYSSRYEYKGGLFDYQDKEFRGFAYVKSIDEENNSAESYFYQEDTYNGRLKKQEIKDKEGRIFSRNINNWQARELASGVNFVYLASSQNYTFAGDENSYRASGAEYEYDEYGNPSKVISKGNLELSGDEKTQVTEYTYNTSSWLLASPKRSCLLDAGAKVVSEKSFFYDNHPNKDEPPSFGLVTKEEVVIFNPLAQVTSSASNSFAYDSFGNLTSLTDSLGRVSATKYDTAFNIFPVEVKNSLGQTSKTVYYSVNESALDIFPGLGLFGQVKYTQDANGQKLYSIYDALGRLVKSIGPNDSLAFPAETFDYYLPSEGSSILKIAKSVKSSYSIQSPAYLKGLSFFDGMGRLIQTKAPAEDGPITKAKRQIISSIVKFDQRGKVREKYVPYFSNYSEEFIPPSFETPHSSFSYDSLGRLININNPDGTYSTVEYSLWDRLITDENSHYKKEYYNAYGKVIKVEENNQGEIFSTLYEYDALSNLTKVTDNQGNTSCIWYDSLGRKIKMDDPDMGIWSYEYDSAGNLIRQVDAKGQELLFAYDALNRLLRKSSPVKSEYYTKLLLHLEGANGSREFIDEAANEVLGAGGARIGSERSKFGGSSLGLDGTGAYLYLSDSADWDFGAGDFTVDFWAYITDITREQVFYSQGDASTANRCYFRLQNGEFSLKIDNASAICDLTTVNSGVSANAWTHLAIVRKNNAFTIYVNGVSKGNLLGSGSFPDSSGHFYIGAAYSSASGGDCKFFSGSIDELRVSKGIARWQANFIPPASAYSSIWAAPIALASYTYDSGSFGIGRLSKVTDQSGSTEFYYDKLGQEIKSVKAVTGSGSFTVERSYDALGRLVTLKYPDAEVLTYSYNPQGIESLIGLSAGASAVTYYIANIDYSPTGQLIKVTYGNGTETNYTYNPDTLRLTNLTTDSSTGRIQDLSYQFDRTGNITELTDRVNTATQSFLYDDLNRLIQAQGSYGSFSYVYDSIGNMTEKEGMRLSYGEGTAGPHAVTSYTLNAIRSTLNYDANGNMVNKGSLNLIYDAENRLAKVEDSSSIGASALSLTLKPGWNFISIPFSLSGYSINTVFASILPKISQVSRYNAVSKNFEHWVNNTKFNQFTALEHGRGYQLYLNSSTDVTLTLSGTAPASVPVILKAGYNLISLPKAGSLDVENALLPLKIGVDYSKALHYNKATSLFEKYDALNQGFISLKPGESYYIYCLKDTSWNIANPKPTATFTYDGDGGRVRKTAGEGGGTQASTTYIGSLYEVEQGAVPKIRKHIFAGPNRVCTLTKDETKKTTDASYYHPDHLGSSSVITDSAGSRVEHYEYTPYGGIAVQDVSLPASLIHHKFTGKELDPTGFYYYGARYYDPEIGRFISADTIVQAPYDPQSLNRYSYCRNNPINYVDPTGHSWKSFWQKFGSTVASVAGVVLAPFTAGASLYLTYAAMVWNGVQAAQAGQFGAFAIGMVAGLVTAGLASAYLAPAMAGFMGGGQALTAFQGAVITATEFGLAGAVAGFAGTLAGGGSLGRAGIAAGIGFGSGAVMGGAIGYTYASGMQDVLHGFDTRGYNQNILLNQIGSGDYVGASRTVGTDSSLRLRLSGAKVHFTNAEGAGGIMNSNTINGPAYLADLLPFKDSPGFTVRTLNLSSPDKGDYFIGLNAKSLHITPQPKITPGWVRTEYVYQGNINLTTDVQLYGAYSNNPQGHIAYMKDVFSQTK